MWKIGDIEIKNKVVLAPMAGITSFAYRKFNEEFGVGLTYTEMISSLGLIYQNQETMTYLDYPESEVPCIVQLFGNDPENLAKSAKIVQKLSPFTKIIDVNMACPVPKVTNNGEGSALLKDPEKMCQIVKRIKEKTGLLVTAKIRLGFDKNSNTVLDSIKALEKGGVSAVALHARTAKDLYLGKPNFEAVRNLRSKMNVPLIISGNINSLEEAIKAMEITGADAVMVARGGEGNPYLIQELVSYFEGTECVSKPSLIEQIGYCLKLAKYLIDEKGEEKAMRIYRGIAPKFFAGFPNAKNIRTKLASNLTTFDSLVTMLNELKADNNI